GPGNGEGGSGGIIDRLSAADRGIVLAPAARSPAKAHPTTSPLAMVRDRRARPVRPAVGTPSRPGSLTRQGPPLSVGIVFVRRNNNSSASRNWSRRSAQEVPRRRRSLFKVTTLGAVAAARAYRPRRT